MYPGLALLSQDGKHSSSLPRPSPSNSPLASLGLIRNVYTLELDMPYQLTFTSVGGRRKFSVGGEIHVNFLELAGTRQEVNSTMVTLFLGYGPLQRRPEHYKAVESSALVRGSRLDLLRFSISGLAAPRVIYSLHFDGRVDGASHLSSSIYFHLREPLIPPWLPAMEDRDRCREWGRTAKQKRQLFIGLKGYSNNTSPENGRERMLRSSRNEGAPSEAQLRGRLSHLSSEQFLHFSPPAETTSPAPGSFVRPWQPSASVPLASAGSYSRRPRTLFPTDRAPIDLGN
jgi:hypothetical protein